MRGLLKRLSALMLCVALTMCDNSISAFASEVCVSSSENSGDIFGEEVSNLFTDEEVGIDTHDLLESEELTTDATIDVENILYDAPGTFAYIVNPDGVSVTITGYVGIQETDDFIIPSTLNGLMVTQIGNEAFEYSNIKGSLVLPDSVTYIGDSAFNGCTGLKGNLVIPNSVTYIGNNAFDHCFGFEGDFLIPNSVKHIGNYAFSGCRGLTGNLVIPNSVTDIGSYAFSYCMGFKGNLVISDSMTQIESGTFCDCTGFTGNLVIPNSITVIGDSAFRYCKGFTGNLIIPDSVTSIGDEAFHNCGGFTGDLVIPDSVTAIGYLTFSDCTGLNGDLVIPDSITEIASHAFEYCSNLSGNLVIPDSVITIDDYAFRGCEGFVGNLVIPDSVTDIRSHAFEGCSGFTGNFVIPNSVTNIGASAFLDCTGLTGDLIIPNSVWHLGSEAFSGCSGFNGRLVISESIYSIGSDTFSGCSGFIGELMIPDHVYYIGDRAFYGCSGLTGKLTIPDSVYQIESYAFSECSGFTGSLVIPKYVRRIEDYAFAGCTGLRGSVTIRNDAVDDVLDLGKNPFAASGITKIINKSSESLLLTVPEGYEPEKWRDASTGEYVESIGKGTVIKEVEGGIEDDMEDENEDKKIYEDRFYYCTYEGNIKTYDFYCDFGWFFEPTDRYNHDLAKMSLKAEMAAFTTPNFSDDPAMINDLMKKLDFENIYTDYSVSDSKEDYDNISYAIGSRPISDGDNEATLILVAVRGAGYHTEWGGNFNVGGSSNKNHNGFDIAAEKVLSGLSNYINNRIRGEIKIWTVGYSRAAATANLLASKLDDGRIPGISPNNVYAYCFETPKNTTDKNAHLLKYNNIFNIVNQVDLIPMVAPSYWGFTRYGITYEMPSRNNSSNAWLYIDRNSALKRILSYKGLAADRLVSEFTHTYVGQEEIWDNLVWILATAIDNRDNYTLFYQQAVQDVATKALDAPYGGQISLSSREMISAILGCIGKIHDSMNVVNEDIFLIMILRRLALMCPELGVNILLPDQSIRDIGDNISHAHYPELCLAWMESLNGDAVVKEKGKRKVYVNCPVDVVVKDSNGNVVGQIVNNEVINEENGILVYVDYNGQKVAVLPMDGEYDVQITATDDGEMTCTVAEFIGESTEASRVVNYSEVQISEGDVLSVEVEAVISEESGNFEGGADYDLEREDGTLVDKSFDASGEEVTYSTITTASIGNGYTDLGGRYLNGEFAQLSATAVDGEEFYGWYDVSGNQISSDESFRFEVKEDGSYVAVFSNKKGAITEDSISVAFDAQGGEGGRLFTEIEKNSIIDIPSEPVKGGYKFLGWYTEKNGKGIKAVPTMKVRESMCFYAYWVKENCTVTFDVTDTDCYNDVSSNMVSIPSSVTVTGGEKLNLDSSDYVPSAGESAPSDKYTFGGWFTAPNGEGMQYTKDTVIIDDVTLYPYWRHTGFDVLEIPDQTYTGKAIKPVIKVYDGTKLLTLNKDYTIEKYSYNTNVAGKTVSKAPSITVKGKGNYSGTETVKFSIVKKDIGDSNVTAADIRLKYNGGKALTVSPVIKYNGLTLTSKNKKDYSYKIYKYDTDVSGNTLETFSEVTSVNATGDYKVVIEGRGNYTGTKEIKLTVLNQILVEKLTISKIADQKYTGSEVTPKITVKNGKKTVPADCYNVSYTNNTEIGTATVTITGNEEKGYSGTKTVTFKIKGTALTSKNVTIKNGDGSAFTASRAYTGTYQRPEIKVTLKVGTKTVTLEKDLDFSVSYSKNKEVGTATITVTGKGKYQGTVKKTFKITPYSLKTDTEGLIRIGGTEGNVLGTPVNNNGTVTFEDADKITVPYVKGGAKPEIKLTWNGRVLKSGTDYTVKYYNNTAVKDENALTKYPYLTVTGKGTFKDSIKVRFSITGRNLNEEVDGKTVTIDVADKAYSSEKNGFKSAPVLKDVNGSVLKSETDYTVVSYTYTADTTVKNNKKSVDRLAGDMVNANDIVPAGTTLMVTVKGKGIYSQPDEEGNTGILTATYTIRAKSLGGAIIKVKDQTYTGKAVEPTGSAVKVTIKEGKKTVTLTENVDYVIESYSNNINQGSKAKITIKPCADEEGNINYSGSKTGTFTIKKKLLRWWWR